MAEAGIRLDRALFPLLIAIGRFGPIGVVDLAERVGRDYTTVSRQVAKLEELSLVKRRASSADRRIREAIIAPAGKGHLLISSMPPASDLAAPRWRNGGRAR